MTARLAAARTEMVLARSATRGRARTRRDQLLPLLHPGRLLDEVGVRVCRGRRGVESPTARQKLPR